MAALRGKKSPLVFLSYSRQDTSSAERLKLDLSVRGVDIWSDTDLRAGDPWERVISNAMERAQIVLVLISRSSIKSNWVTAEWHSALATSKRVIPILLEGATYAVLGCGRRSCPYLPRSRRRARARGGKPPRWTKLSPYVPGRRHPISGAGKYSGPQRRGGKSETAPATTGRCRRPRCWPAAPTTSGTPASRSGSAPGWTPWSAPAAPDTASRYCTRCTPRCLTRRESVRTAGSTQHFGSGTSPSDDVHPRGTPGGHALINSGI